VLIAHHTDHHSGSRASYGTLGKNAASKEKRHTLSLSLYRKHYCCLQNSWHSPRRPSFWQQGFLWHFGEECCKQGEKAHLIFEPVPQTLLLQNSWHSPRRDFLWLQILQQFFLTHFSTDSFDYLS
jgi:hypothetical protein